jgi:hypothetical protein
MVADDRERNSEAGTVDGSVVKKNRSLAVLSVSLAISATVFGVWWRAPELRPRGSLCAEMLAVMVLLLLLSGQVCVLGFVRPRAAGLKRLAVFLLRTGHLMVLFVTMLSVTGIVDKPQEVLGDPRDALMLEVYHLNRAFGLHLKETSPVAGDLAPDPGVPGGTWPR